MSTSCKAIRSGSASIQPSPASSNDFEFLQVPECCLIADRIPIVYSQGYDFGVEHLTQPHPFQRGKRRKVFEHLTRRLGIEADQVFAPRAASDDELMEIHPCAYIHSLREPAFFARMMGFPALRAMPQALLDETFLEPMRLAVGGTLLGMQLAREHGWAINLSGGFHHAGAGYGSGFCVLADIPLAAKRLWRRDSLVVDTLYRAGIPVLMLLSGAYARRSWEVIGNSIANLVLRLVIGSERQAT